MKELLNRILKIITLLWVFIIPYQIFFTSGVSISLAIVLLVITSPLLMYKYVSEGSVKDVLISLVRKYSLVITLIIFVILSYLLNFETASLKETARWALFGIEIFVVLEVLRLKVVSKNHLVVASIFSMLVMLALTSYQLFITPYEELKLVRDVVGSIFNDPDFIVERFNGVGKFNWLYGNSLRVHGVFANVSHFAFILGALFILAITSLKGRYEKYKYPILVVFSAFITLSLVRSVFLSLGLILLIGFMLMIRSKVSKVVIRNYILGLVGGGFLAVTLSLFSANQIIFWSLIVRTFETISFDGALFANQLTILNSYFQTVNISSGEFNEYGGVGGRMNLMKITLQEVVIPNLMNIKFLLFGFGPASLGSLLKNTQNAYFSAFNTVDNSYLQWIVEIGLIPFITAGFWLKKFWGWFMEVFSKYWMLILYIVINAFFFNLLPDIRMAMFVAVLIGIIFGDE
ncbi:MAG TPA: hypothetical protein PLV59_02620 [Candidatus Dojkabacteria bacterium]|nr:hypothetical protein [Candidatus Dojkabacteria bacterium]